MFSHTVSRSVLGVLLVATLLVPAAQADDWARDNSPGRSGDRDRDPRPCEPEPAACSARSSLVDYATRRPGRNPRRRLTGAARACGERGLRLEHRPRGRGRDVRNAAARVRLVDRCALRARSRHERVALEGDVERRAGHAARPPLGSGSTSGCRDPCGSARRPRAFAWPVQAAIVLAAGAARTGQRRVDEF